MLPARNADHHLIEVPFVPGRGQTPPDLVGIALPELQRPLPHGLVADLDASCREHLLYHAQTERKPKIKPDDMADHLSWEAVAGIARMTS
jgi:hypothetical protein